jgi:pilus assembly protein CpaE
MQTLAAAVQIGSEELRQEVKAALLTCGIAISDQAPDLVVMDPEAVAQTERLPAAPPVLVAHTAPEPQAILDALRAGAREFLYPPFEQNLRKALDKIAADLAASSAGVRRKARVIGVLSAKGGCGATTVACHLAVELQRATQQRVLLADLDFELGSVGFVMKASSKYSVLDAVLNSHRLDRSFWKALVSNGRPSLEILAAPEPSAGAPGLRRDNLRPVLQFMRSQYEWVLLDLGRGMSSVTVAALDDVDELLLTTTTDVAALFHSRQIVERLCGSRYGSAAEAPNTAAYASNRIRVVVNRVATHGSFGAEQLSRAIGHTVFSQLPAEEATLAEAYSAGALLPEKCPLRRAIAQMAAKIAGVAEEKPQRRFRWFGS